MGLTPYFLLLYHFFFFFYGGDALGTFYFAIINFFAIITFYIYSPIDLFLSLKDINMISFLM
jgi:hypothetical protein